MDKKEFSKRINFAKLRELMRTPDLTPVEKCVMVDLILYAGSTSNAFPSQQTLANNLGYTSRYIRGCLQRLRSRGWIVSWKKRGYSQSNLYVLNEELYFRNDTKYGKSVSSHLGSQPPIQSGTPFPPKVSHESNQLSSSEVLLQFQQASKNKCTHSDRRRLHELCEKYSKTWVLDAIKDASTRGYPYLKVGLISNILEDWSTDGKPQPKPVFHPCGKNGCSDGWIITDEGNARKCHCRENYDEQRKQGNATE